MNGLFLPLLQTLLLLGLLSWSPVHGLPAMEIVWLTALATAWIVFSLRESPRTLFGGLFVPLLLWPLWPSICSWSWSVSGILHAATSFLLDLTGSPFGTSASSFRIDGVLITSDPMKTATLALVLLLLLRLGRTLIRSGTRAGAGDLLLLVPLFVGFGTLRWSLVAPLLVSSNPDLVTWAPSLFYGPLLGLSLLPILFLPCPEPAPAQRAGSRPFIAWAFVVILLFIGQVMPWIQPTNPPRMLIEESHSDWEPLLPPVSVLSQPVLAENNYRPLLNRLLSIASVTIALSATSEDHDRPPGLEITRWEGLMSEPRSLEKYKILVIKCPTRPYSSDDRQRILQWVDQGGTLFLIGDHTDVVFMNSALNEIIASTGVRFASDGICDSRGRWLTTCGPLHAPFPWAPGNARYSWATGASIEGTANFLPLMVSAPNSFSDPAVRTNHHFFGTLVPDLKTRYGPFTLAGALPWGRGSIFLHGDSTNFNASMISTPGKTGFLEHFVRSSNFPVNVAALSLVILLISGILGCQALGCLLRARHFALGFLAILLQFLFVIDLPTVWQTNRSMMPAPVLVDLSLSPSLGLTFGDQRAICASDSLNSLVVSLENLGFGCTASFAGLDESLKTSPGLVLLADPASPPSIKALRALQRYLRMGGICLLACRQGLSGVPRSLALSLGLREAPSIDPSTGLPSVLSPGAATLMMAPGLGFTRFPLGSGTLFLLEGSGNALPLPLASIAELLVDPLLRR